MAWKPGERVDADLLVWVTTEWAKERGIPATFLKRVGDGTLQPFDPEVTTSEP
jgi:hypothetical protein